MYMFISDKHQTGRDLLNSVMYKYILITFEKCAFGSIFDMNESSILCYVCCLAVDLANGTLLLHLVSSFHILGSFTTFTRNIQQQLLSVLYVYARNILCTSVIVVFPSLIFCLLPSNRLSWLTVSFWQHVKRRVSLLFTHKTASHSEENANVTKTKQKQCNIQWLLTKSDIYLCKNIQNPQNAIKFSCTYNTVIFLQALVDTWT